MQNVASTTRAAPDEQALLDEMLDVLRTASSNGAPSRSLAVRYTAVSTALTASALKPLLPTWLFQCVSVFKFHEFITLYAADIGPRMAFIEQSFEGCRSANRRARRFDVFGDEG